MPLSGIEPSSAADRTPGTARIRPSACSANWAMAVSLSYFADGSRNSAVSNRSGSKPSGTCRMRSRLRVSRPAATSSTMQSASCTATKIVRASPRPGAAPSPVRVWSASARPARAAQRAGSAPNRRPAPTVIATEKKSTGPSSSTGPSAGSPPGAAATSATMAQRARRIPHTPPMAASTRFSVSSCRTSRPRPAPSAARSDSSRRREVERASCRLAMLAQAMSRISATKPSRMSSVGRVFPTRYSRSGTTDAPTPALVAGNSAASARAMAERSACACARVAPGLSMPTAQKAGLSRVNQLALGADVTGSQISGGPNGSV